MWYFKETTTVTRFRSINDVPFFRGGERRLQKFSTRNLADGVLECFHGNCRIKDGWSRLLCDMRASGNYITGSGLLFGLPVLALYFL
jgi:hypothetical protein